MNTFLNLFTPKTEQNLIDTEHFISFIKSTKAQSHYQNNEELCYYLIGQQMILFKLNFESLFNNRLHINSIDSSQLKLILLNKLRLSNEDEKLDKFLQKISDINHKVYLTPFRSNLEQFGFIDETTPLLETMKREIRRNNETTMNFFSIIDKNKDKRITKKEFSFFFNYLLQTFPKEDIDKLFIRFDIDNDGIIDINEFLNTMGIDRSFNQEDISNKPSYNIEELRIMTLEEKAQLTNVLESIKFKIRSENLSFESLFLSKDLLNSGYLIYPEIRSIIEKELGLFHPNLNILQYALADNEDKISLKSLGELLASQQHPLNQNLEVVIKEINEKEIEIKEIMRNIDYEGKNTVNFKQFYEILKQKHINTNEDELYRFFCENKLIIDIYDDLLNYNDTFSFLKTFLKPRPSHITPIPNTINITLLESIIKIIKNKLKALKITIQVFFKNIPKTPPASNVLEFKDFTIFLSDSLGLYDLLNPEQILGIFTYFDIDRDSKLSYSDFFSTITSKDLVEDKIILEENNGEKLGTKKSSNFHYVKEVLQKLLQKNNKINKRELYQSFCLVDINKDGLISYSEFLKAFTNSGLVFDITDIKFLYQNYDTLYSSFIDYERFLNDLFIEKGLYL